MQGGQRDFMVQVEVKAHPFSSEDRNLLEKVEPWEEFAFWLQLSFGSWVSFVQPAHPRISRKSVVGAPVTMTALKEIPLPFIPRTTKAGLLINL